MFVQMFQKMSVLNVTLFSLDFCDGWIWITHPFLLLSLQFPALPSPKHFMPLKHQLGWGEYCFTTILSKHTWGRVPVAIKQTLFAVEIGFLG